MFKHISTCPCNKKAEGICKGSRKGTALNINCSTCPAYKKYVEQTVKER